MESHQRGRAGPWSEAFHLVLDPPPGGFPQIVKASKDYDGFQPISPGENFVLGPSPSWRLPRDCDRIPRFRWILANLTWGAVQAYGRKLTGLWSKAFNFIVVVVLPRGFPEIVKGPQDLAYLSLA